MFEALCRTNVSLTSTVSSLGAVLKLIRQSTCQVEACWTPCLCTYMYMYMNNRALQQHVHVEKKKQTKERHNRTRATRLRKREIYSGQVKSRILNC